VKRRLTALAIVAMLGISVRYAAERPGEWLRRSKESPSAFDLFVVRARAAIPETARVRIVSPRGPLDDRAGALAGRLYPRAVVREGPADWEIVLPAGEGSPELRRIP